MREYATHLAGEFAGELLGERIDDFVEKAVGSVLGIPHEEDSDPLLGDGSELGEAIAEALADGKWDKNWEMTNINQKIIFTMYCVQYLPDMYLTRYASMRHCHMNDWQQSKSN